MEPLQEHARLFANGKFKLLIEGVEKDTQLVERFIGIYGKEWLITDVEENTPIDNCTLIARPISDMSDEELYNFFESYADGKGDVYMGMFNRDELIGTATDTRKSASQFLYLLSIGVYPFGQSDFGETVIDSTTL